MKQLTEDEALEPISVTNCSDRECKFGIGTKLYTVAPGASVLVPQGYTTPRVTVSKDRYDVSILEAMAPQMRLTSDPNKPSFTWDETKNVWVNKPKGKAA